jgi:hypothetical protein
MALDYNQRQLLNTALYKTKGKRATLSNMRKKELSGGRLQIYAFWMGFMSTVISLIQVIVIALKK